MNDAIAWNRKDKSPEETIEKITGILHAYGMDITIVDVCKHNTMWYSMNIEISQLPGVFTNGKGISYEYALASALGEMMERLQSGFLLSPLYPVFKSNVKTANINLSIMLTYQYLFNIFKNCPPQKMYSFLEKNPQYAQVEYYKNQRTGNVAPLPHGFIHYLCGSNGTCAGNSREEALCQGICELFERYALKCMYYSPNFKCQTISHAAISRCKSYILIKEIESKGFHCVIKDCSMNNTVPVIALLVFNKNKTKYAFSMGSDPDFDICLQRCITEMFQGKDFNFTFRSSMQDVWKISNMMYNCTENVLNTYYTNALIDKSSPIPLFMLTSFPQTDQIPSVFFPLSVRKNNQEAFEYVVKLCENCNWDVWINDCSFLGFPTYRVYIPGISEAFYLPNSDVIYMLNVQTNLQRLIINYDTRSNEEKKLFTKQLSDFLSFPRYANTTNFGRLMGLIFKPNKTYNSYLFYGKELLLRLSIENEMFDISPTDLSANSCNMDKYKLMTLFSHDKNGHSLVNVTRYLLEDENSNVNFEMKFPTCPKCNECSLYNFCGIESYRLITQKIDSLKSAMDGLSKHSFC